MVLKAKKFGDIFARIKEKILPLHRFFEKIEDFFILGVIDFRKACI